MRRSWFHVLIMLSIVELASCGSSPQKDVISVEQAIAQARAAEADIYAPDDLHEATVKLASARRKIEVESRKSVFGRSYEDATELLASAKLAAHRAFYEAGDRREEVREMTEETLRIAHGSLSSAKAAVARLERGGYGAEMSEDFERQLYVLEEVLSKAEMDFGAGNYAEARDNAEAVLSEAGEVKRKVASALKEST